MLILIESLSSFQLIFAENAIFVIVKLPSFQRIVTYGFAHVIFTGCTIFTMEIVFTFNTFLVSFNTDLAGTGGRSIKTYSSPARLSTIAKNTIVTVHVGSTFTRGNAYPIYTGGLGSLDRKQGFISEKLLWFMPQPVSAELC